MTATQIFEHPKYLDSGFTFKGEKWIILNFEGFSRYRMSNFFRVKNYRTGHILKPIARRNSHRYTLALYNDDNKAVKFNMETIFGNFEIYTEKRRRGSKEFIYDAF